MMLEICRCHMSTPVSLLLPEWSRVEQCKWQAKIAIQIIDLLAGCHLLEPQKWWVGQAVSEHHPSTIDKSGLFSSSPKEKSVLPLGTIMSYHWHLNSECCMDLAELYPCSSIFKQESWYRDVQHSLTKPES